MIKKHLQALGLASMLAVSPALANGDIDFEIGDGKVVPSESFAAMVSVLGTAITFRGDNVPVTVKAQIGDNILEPWGEFSSTLGDVNDNGPIRHFIYEEQLDAGEEIVISGQSFLRGSSFISVNSHEQSDAVKVLRNGDPAPTISGFDGQSTAEFFIRQYLANGQVNIDDNQVIYLFELGTTQLTSSAADFQDLVVLVTLGESVEALQNRFEPLYD